MQLFYFYIYKIFAYQKEKKKEWVFSLLCACVVTVLFDCLTKQRILGLVLWPKLIK